MWYIDVRDAQDNLVWCGAYSDESKARYMYDHCVEKIRESGKYGSVILNHDGHMVQVGGREEWMEHMPEFH